MLPKLPQPAGRSEMMTAPAGSQTASQDTTVSLHVDTVNLRMSSTQLDYNFLDLDLTAQHVQMPSVLNETAVVKERRTNLADVLKLAIEREPDRHDLRMKLLELYYSAAATNRKAFLEVVQKFARDRDYLNSDQWDKIAFMGRQIASDNPLFAEEAASDDDLANCA
jgi:pilus assembly protein FimV